MNLARKYWNLPAKDKLILTEATILLVFVKFLVIFLPLRWYSFLLGKQNSETDVTIAENSRHIIFKISQAIARSEKIIPWKSKCLTEAITARMMLKKRKLKSTLYLGVNKKGDTMVAHAWLRCGNIYVTGRRGIKKFVVLSSFA